MEYFINCNTSPLTPFTGTLNQHQVAHLYRRLGFSASIQTINDGTTQTAESLVNQLINEAINTTPVAAPNWATWNNNNYPKDSTLAAQIRREQTDELSLAYAKAMLTNNLSDRLSFFWSNHFVTELEVYDCSAFLYEYLNCLQRNAIGNFKTFVSEIGLTNAMLYYLDGVYNNGNNPNENYARELYELFTLGEGNGYTERDITETARALSGYVERGSIGCEAVRFSADRHDSGSKTILGQVGNWGYDDVIDILFEQRANEIAKFICRKLYEFFVHPDSKDESNNAQTIINELAAAFVANNFEIAPVLSILFKSEHFFDDEAIGVIIKSPFDFYFNTLKETNFNYNDTLVSSFIYYSGLLSQQIFEPVDVAGWQRNRSWINTNFMIGRWLSIESVIKEFYLKDTEQFRTFAMDIVGNIGLTSNNPDEIARPIIDFLLPKGLLNEAEYTKAFTVFRSDVDDTYYEGGTTPSWTLAMWAQASFQVQLLLQYLVKQPEFQLK